VCKIDRWLQMSLMDNFFGIADRYLARMDHADARRDDSSVGTVYAGLFKQDISTFLPCSP